MKNFLMIFAFFFSISIALQAQNTSNKIKPHKIWITQLDGSKVSGRLYAADEGFVKIAQNNSLDVSNLTSINSEQIDFVKIRRKGKIGRGAWIGAVSGAGLGVFIGLTTESDGWEGVVATGSGIMLGAIGTGIGAGIGAFKKKLSINGNLEVYKSHLQEIQSYSLVPKNDNN